MKRLFVVTVAAVALACATRLANAGPIVVGNGAWYTITWTGLISAKGCGQGGGGGGFFCQPGKEENTVFADAPPWTFTGAALLTVTDADIAIDRFEVFDNLLLLGLTSVPTNGPGVFCDKPSLCMVDPHFSHGIFLLGPGAHSITINQILNPTLGVGFFRVDAVPEPNIWFLVGSALCALRLRRRSRTPAK